MENSLFDQVYRIQVESHYQEKIAYKPKRHARTGRESVLQFLLENKQQIWWWAWELIGKTTSKGDWLSHRAPARASDLAIHEPELVEHRSIGRFKVYRLRRENMDLIIRRLEKHEGNS